MTFYLRSSAFTDQGSIPRPYTCEGADISPPLGWSGAPPSTQSLALIVEDPDAPDPRAPRMTWVHWVLYNIPVAVHELPAGASKSGTPAGTGQGLNDWKRARYGGPCPPVGRHRYFHRLYALDRTLQDLGTPTKAQLLGAMKGHILAEAVLIGTYEKEH